MNQLADQFLQNYEGRDWLLKRKAKTVFFLNAFIILILFLDAIVSSLLLKRLAPEFYSNVSLALGLILTLFILIRGNYSVASALCLVIALIGITWTRYASTSHFSSDASYDFMQYAVDLVLIIFYSNLIAYRKFIIYITFISCILLFTAYTYVLPNYLNIVILSYTKSVIISGFFFLFLAGFIGMFTFLQNIKAIEVANLESQRSKEKERNYREIFNSTNEAIFIHDASTGKIIDVNDAMLGMYQFETNEQAIIHSIEDLSANYSPYTEKEAQKNLQDALVKGPQTFEWLAKNTNEELFWTEVSLRKSEIGGKGRILAVVRNINERKRAEESLNETESRIKSISNNFTTGMIYQVIAHQDGTRQFTYLSDSVRQLYGVMPENGLADATLIYSRIYKDDIESLAKAELNAIKTCSTFKMEARVVNPNGEIRWSSFTSTPKKLDNGSICFDGIEFIITEHKIAEQKLQASEERFRLILENMPILLNAFDEKGNIIAWNKACEETTGYKAYEIISNPKAMEILYPNPGYLTEVWETSLNPMNKNNTFDLIAKNGEVRTIEWFDVYHRLTIPGWASWGMGLDITERKKAELALIEGEDRLQKLLNSVTDYIYSVKIENGKVKETIHGEGCISVTGYSSPELKSDKYLWYKIIHNNDKAEVLDHAEKIILNKTVKPIEHRIVHKNGSVRWVRNTPVIHYNAEGLILGYDGLITDITERKLAEEQLIESENRYRNLFENANDAIFIMKGDRYIDCNLMTMQLFGYPKEKIISMSPWDVSPQFQSDGQLSIVKGQNKISLCIEGKPQRFEWQHMHADKTIFDTEVSLNQLELSGEKFLLAVVRDISQRKKLEKEVYIASFNGEENERARVAKDLHDGLGPLLSACKIYLHTLNSSKFNSEDAISYNKLGLLLDESMFSIKEISNNLSPHILRNFGLVQALKSFVEKIKTDVKFDITCNSEAGKRYNDVMEISLYRVLIELINNSLKYANASLITIILEEKDDTYCVQYKDNGKGFNYNKALKQAKGFGLINLQSRIISIGGKFDFKSKINEGVDVEMTINL